MHAVVGNIYYGNGIGWFFVKGPLEYEDVDGIWISFPFATRVNRRGALECITEHLEMSGVTWLSPIGREWRVNLDELRELNAEWHNVAWMTGTVSVEPEIETEDRFRGDEETSVRLFVTREEIELAGNNRIFLSHKGVDKPLVRQISSALELIGFRPWLDEAEMNAGAELDRALLQGMKESCAAVFFVTPSFQDDDFLATEVDYAVAEKRSKKDDFSIICLRLQHRKAKGKVPPLLEKYVWKEPETELDIFTEIIKALPLSVGEVRRR